MRRHGSRPAPGPIDGPRPPRSDPAERAPRAPGSSYARHMHTIELNDEDLRLLRSAIQACVREFGHDEADVLHAYQALLARLPSPERAADPA